MSKFNDKKKAMAKKMETSDGAKAALSSIPSYLRRDKGVDSAGKNAKGKDSITKPGKNNQSSRKMP